MNPTLQQINAIETRNKTLLVSAGAGSGKTTVLTRRLIERIKAGESVIDFLVVTFMKAAAADVKRKLYDALLKESARNPNDKHLYNETHLVSEANICTISSYCLALVKENFALLGISPKVRVIDETEAALLLRRITNELIKKGYEDEDSSFLMLVDNFSGEKSDDKLADKMIKLYNTLGVTLEREEMLLACAKALDEDAEATLKNGFFASTTGEEYRQRLMLFYDELLESAKEMYDYGCNCGDDRCAANQQTVLKLCQNVCDASRADYVNFINAAYEACSTPTFTKYKNCDPEIHEHIKNIKGDIAKALKSYYERYCCGSEAIIAESFTQSAALVRCVNSFLNSMDSEYRKAKLEINALDYTDFERLALELLETTDEFGNKVPTELCLRKQESFREILIDEYQDVNPLQDRLFTLLAGKSYRFMVGDVKQSIYRFRNAYPDIFISYKKKFPEISNAENSNSACIFLRENFRCSQTVINYVNHVFRCITENTPYRDEYEDEWLVFPDSKLESANKSREFPVVLAIAEKEKDNAKESRRNEAEYIASEISRLVRNETDAEGNPIKYSDIAVMMSVMKNYTYEYEKAFRKFGIPYKTAVSENFLENPVISLAVSALKAIDDSTDDISVCALLRSPICNFSSNDLYRIRNFITNTDFYTALTAYAVSRGKRIVGSRYKFTKRKAENTHLVSRCRGVINRLSAWRAESTGIPCADFLKSFFVSSGLLRIAADGSRSSLLLLYEYATKYENAQNYGISGFLDYIAELSKSGKEIADVASVGEEDAISFITVHKSKGLEFKVCFLACTDKEFKGMKDSGDINFRRGKGIFFKLRNRENLTSYNPITNILAFDHERDIARGEELRKLYVALTRAKERLYITGCIEPQKLEKKYNTMTAKSWLELLLYAASFGECSFFNVKTIDSAEGRAGYIAPEARSYIIPTKEMVDIIRFKYPYENAVASVAKISVSELREGLLEDDEYNRTHLSVPMSRVSLKPAFAETSQVTAADIGTANHLFMQFCDFKNAESSVENEANRLLNRRMLTESQFNMLDFKALQAFFRSELYKLIKESKCVYREKRFSVQDVLQENGEPVLIQGVIDCFFQNPDGSFTVVDYKTDRVKTYDELVARHQTQLSCYRRSVERMTGCRVSRVLLYSFALGGEIDVL